MIDEDQARELVLDGWATIDPMQLQPPTVFLDELKARASHPDGIGRPATSKKTLAELSEGLVTNGIRQSMVKGASMPWIDGTRRLKSEVKRCLGKCNDIDRDLFRQIDEVLGHYKMEHSERVNVYAVTSVEMLRKSHIVVARSGNFIDRTRKGFRFKPAWYAFNDSLRQISLELDALIEDAVAIGRIICCEDTGHGDRVVHPDQAAF